MIYTLGQKYKSWGHMLNDVISDVRSHILRHFPERQIYLKEENTRLMLAEQQASFETMARQLEQKHQTLSQMMGKQTSTAALASSEMTTYADDRVLMSPATRDTTPREARNNVIKTASLTTGLAFDNSLNALGATQDDYLIQAESETQDRIERNRALIQSTDMDIETILKSAAGGTGGPFIPTAALTPESNGFISRIEAIQARAVEAEVLETAVTSLPLGHPVMGSTGRSTANHLHYEIHFQGRAYDPSKFLKAGLYVQ